MKTTSLFIIPLLTAASVSAHGYVSQVLLNGKVFKGNAPGEEPKPSIIRQTTHNDPIYGADSADLTCGNSAHQPASLVVDINPGDTVQFTWSAGPKAGVHWPHDTGPIMTYLASCGSVPCNEFDSAEAKWFKIDQQGLKFHSTDENPGGWVTQAGLCTFSKLFSQHLQVVSSSLPFSLSC